VPINGALRPYLAEAKAAATCPFVIEHGPEQIASIKAGFKAAYIRAKLAGVSPHALRHTTATWQIQAGVPLEKVAAYLGNRKEMVEKVYGHHSPEWLQEGAEALAGPVGQFGASGPKNSLQPRSEGGNSALTALMVRGNARISR
jgi:integrase